MHTITCKGCGEELSASDEDALVTAVQEHIGAAHPRGHEPSREQIREITRKRGARES